MDKDTKKGHGKVTNEKDVTIISDKIKEKNNIIKIKDKDTDKVVEKRMNIAAENKKSIKEKQDSEFKKKGYLPEQKVLKCLSKSEKGDKELYVKLNKNKFTYDASDGKWYYYNNFSWEEDKNRERIIAADNVTNCYEQEISRQNFHLNNNEIKLSDDEKEKIEKIISKLNERIKKLSKKKRIETVVDYAACGILNSLVFDKKWDEKKNLIALKNGVVDIDSELKDKRVKSTYKDYIKSSFNIEYDPEAKCPLWESTLKTTFNDHDVIPYLQRVFGYSFSRNPKEHIFLIFYGPHARNGKTLIMEIFKAMMGIFSAKIQATYFLKSKSSKDASGPDANLMHLKGKMTAYSSETGPNDRMDLSKVKEFTGGDTLSGRPLYGPIEEFNPDFVLFLITNNKPIIEANDEGMRERVRLLHFENKFVREPTKSYERQIDKDLFKNLLKELSGIFNWTVRGYQDQKKNGLQTPSSVKESTTEYIENEDVVGNFLKERFTFGDPTSKVKSSIIYQSYRVYCNENKITEILSQIKLSEDLKDKRGFKKTTERDAAYFHNMFLNVEYDIYEDD